MTIHDKTSEAAEKIDLREVAVAAEADAIIDEGVSFAEFLVRYNGQRVEWLGGKVAQKMSNNERHHALLGFLYLLMSLYLQFKSLGKVYFDGYAMFVGEDKPARQPDLLIVLEEHYDRIGEQYLDGAADVVMEIASPSTASVDRGAKFIEYEAAGVPEYWLIDPTRETVTLHALTDDVYKQVLPAEDGTLHSRTLPGFMLDPSLLWRDALPQGTAIVEMAQAMHAE